jgi:hypothetical protein
VNLRWAYWVFGAPPGGERTHSDDIQQWVVTRFAHAQPERLRSRRWPLAAANTDDRQAAGVSRGKDADADRYGSRRGSLGITSYL